MSSSEVRKRIKEGLAWEDTVPEEVAQRIKEKGLYQ
jgi:nicotinic acid mononucleotide adenylyltransferase